MCRPFPPGSRGEHQIGQLGRFGGVIHVLNDQKIEARQDIAEHVLVDPRMSRVGGDDPQPFDLLLQDAFDDLVVGPASAVGNTGQIDA